MMLDVEKKPVQGKRNMIRRQREIEEEPHLSFSNIAIQSKLSISNNLPY